MDTCVASHLILLLMCKLQGSARESIGSKVLNLIIKLERILFGILENSHSVLRLAAYTQEKVGPKVYTFSHSMPVVMGHFCFVSYMLLISPLIQQPTKDAHTERVHAEMAEDTCASLKGVL